MIIRKVPGENKIYPIKISESEYRNIQNVMDGIGDSIENYIPRYLDYFAKKRNWNWWFNGEEYYKKIKQKDPWEGHIKITPRDVVETEPPVPFATFISK